jgi:arginyl-tRNA synthetase
VIIPYYLVESDNCKCIFLENDDVPIIIQKSDGGYTYSATDMAAIWYRFNELKVDEIVYLTDIGQKDHFDKIFKAAEISRFYDPSKQTPIHIGLGLIKGEDGKKMKSRAGDSVKLHTLLDEAKDRALDLLNQRINMPNISEHLEGKDLSKLAETIAINSIKYFDFKQNPGSSYKFSFDKMLDTKGNTGVYITYMYARICSVLSKYKDCRIKLDTIIQELTSELADNPSLLNLDTPEEIALAISILRFPESIEEALLTNQLASKICENLYDISSKLAEFYQQHKVLGHPNQTSRLLLLCATKLILEKHFY